MPEPTAHANALIVLPWLSWPGCASQRLCMEKSWPSWEVDPTPSRVTLLHEGKSHFWQSQLFVLHENGLPSFKRNVGRLGSPRVAWVGEWPYYQRQGVLTIYVGKPEILVGKSFNGSCHPVWEGFRKYGLYFDAMQFFNSGYSADLDVFCRE